MTSLDVVHSFWAYQLAVKADANPGVDNIAYVTTKGPLTFNIHCAELCGVWHGYMFDTGQRRSEDRSSPPGSPSSGRSFAPATKSLPLTQRRISQTHKGEVDDRYRDTSASRRCGGACLASTC